MQQEPARDIMTSPLAPGAPSRIGPDGKHVDWCRCCKCDPKKKCSSWMLP